MIVKTANHDKENDFRDDQDEFNQEPKINNSNTSTIYDNIQNEQWIATVWVDDNWISTATANVMNSCWHLEGRGRRGVLRLRASGKKESGEPFNMIKNKCGLKFVKSALQKKVGGDKAEAKKEVADWALRYIAHKGTNPEVHVREMGREIGDLDLGKAHKDIKELRNQLPHKEWKLRKEPTSKICKRIPAQKQLLK